MYETMLTLKEKYDHGFDSLVVRYKSCAAIAQFVTGPATEGYQISVWLPIDFEEAEDFADEFDSEVRLEEMPLQNHPCYDTEGEALAEAFRRIDALLNG